MTHPTTPPPDTLTTDQRNALEAIESWLKHDEPPSFFVLSGFAGTGKTYLLQLLQARHKGRVVFCAPTNKATRVLKEVLKKPDFNPICRTIYSLLGLRLEANGEVKELAVPEEPLDLTEYYYIVVDEASMVSKVLFEHIQDAARGQNLRFLFLGDKAQLPPVGEAESIVWKEAQAKKADLREIVRYGGPILELVTKIRIAGEQPVPTLILPRPTNQPNLTLDWEGVERLTNTYFTHSLQHYAKQGVFSKPNAAKAIAWTNARTTVLNRVIREAIFDNVSSPWVETDRVVFTAPAKDADSEPAASTDDEGTIMSVRETYHPLYSEFKIYSLSIVLDTGLPVTAYVRHESSDAAFVRKSAELADEARSMPKRWKAFWEFKDAFHSVRHAYALTAHRSQGSTFVHAFVDTFDILKNQNRHESFQCLYVACSRAKTRLTLM